MVSTESMLRELVENAHDLIFCLDPDGRFVYTNPAWRATLGYSEQELESRNLFDMIH
jgi:PAS domain S-box-containing protein